MRFRHRALLVEQQEEFYTHCFEHSNAGCLHCPEGDGHRLAVASESHKPVDTRRRANYFPLRTCTLSEERCARLPWPMPTAWSSATAGNAPASCFQRDGACSTRAPVHPIWLQSDRGVAWENRFSSQTYRFAQSNGSC